MRSNLERRLKFISQNGGGHMEISNQSLNKFGVRVMVSQTYLNKFSLLEKKKDVYETMFELMKYDHRQYKLKCIPILTKANVRNNALLL